MKKLGDDIIEQGFNANTEKQRISARGIFINDKKEVLCIHSTYYDDVTLPGGGVEFGENIVETLYRECLEEVGAVVATHEEFYQITEKRNSNEGFNTFTSYYYICSFSELKEPCLLDYEIKLGYTNKWMSFDDAIYLNEKTLKKLKDNNKYFGVVEREIRIFKKLKEIYI